MFISSFQVKNPLFEEYTDEFFKKFNNVPKNELNENKISKEELYVFDLNSNSKLDDQKTSLETSLIDEDLMIDEDNSQSIYIITPNFRIIINLLTLEKVVEKLTTSSRTNMNRHDELDREGLIADLSPIKQANFISSNLALNDIDKQNYKFNEDQRYQDDRTEMFLTKINAHITNNKLSNKSLVPNSSSTISCGASTPSLSNQSTTESHKQNRKACLYLHKLLIQDENCLVNNSSINGKLKHFNILVYFII